MKITLINKDALGPIKHRCKNAFCIYLLNSFPGFIGHVSDKTFDLSTYLVIDVRST